jgi:serine/arginine repetitive matrix protein 1
MAATVDEKLVRATKFPLEFNQKVDMQKVNIEVMKTYAAFGMFASINVC